MALCVEIAKTLDSLGCNFKIKTLLIMKKILLICLILLANIQGPLFTVAQVINAPSSIKSKVVVKPAFAVEVFPNPTTDKLTISYTEACALSNVEIYNLLGRLIKRFPAESTTSTTLSMEKFSAGLYLVKLNGKEQTKTFRVKRI